MQLALYQILVPAFCVLMIAKTVSHFLRHERTVRELLAILVFWGGIAALALFPDVMSVVAGFLGIKSNVNAVIFIILGILSYLCLYLFISVENLEHQVTLLTRQLALRDKEDAEK